MFDNMLNRNTCSTYWAIAHFGTTAGLGPATPGSLSKFMSCCSRTWTVHLKIRCSTNWATSCMFMLCYGCCAGQIRTADPRVNVAWHCCWHTWLCTHKASRCSEPTELPRIVVPQRLGIEPRYLRFMRLLSAHLIRVLVSSANALPFGHRTLLFSLRWGWDSNPRTGSTRLRFSRPPP